MSTNQIAKKIETLLEWEKLMEEAKAEADALRNDIKQEMMIRNTEELNVGQYIVRWTSVLSQRFDATAFKKGYAGYLQGLPKTGQQQAIHHRLKFYRGGRNYV